MIAIIGKAGAGKTTLADIIAYEHNLKACSTSSYAFDHVIYKGMEYCYKSKLECLNNKDNDRHLWSALISQYNHKDKGRLVKEMLDKYEIIEGIRKQEELDAVKEHFSLIIGLVRVGNDKPDPTFEIDIVTSSDIVLFSNNIMDLRDFSRSIEVSY